MLQSEFLTVKTTHTVYFTNLQQTLQIFGKGQTVHKFIHRLDGRRPDTVYLHRLIVDRLYPQKTIFALTLLL